MASPLHKAWKFIDIPLSWAETIIVLGLLTSVLFLAFSQVVMRWFGGGYIWADELVRYMVLWLGVFGAASATRHRKHIAIDAFQQLIPVGPRKWVRRGCDLVASILAFALAKATYEYMEFVADEKSATLGVTVDVLTWPILVALCWIAVRFIADAILGVEFDQGHSPSPTIDPQEFDNSLHPKEA